MTSTVYWSSTRVRPRVPRRCSPASLQRFGRHRQRRCHSSRATPTRGTVRLAPMERTGVPPACAARSGSARCWASPAWRVAPGIIAGGAIVSGAALLSEARDIAAVALIGTGSVIAYALVRNRRHRRSDGLPTADADGVWGVRGQPDGVRLCDGTPRPPLCPRSRSVVPYRASTVSPLERGLSASSRRCGVDLHHPALSTQPV